MSIPNQLAVLALRPLLSGACSAIGLTAAESSLAGVIVYLRERFTDHGQKISDALRRASERAWRALEIALAGESLLSRLDRNEDKAFREQVRRFLDAWPADDRPRLDESVRADTLRELRAARKAGLLDASALNPDELATRLGPLARHADPMAFIQAEWLILGEVAGEVRAAHYDNLAAFLAARPANGESLLVVSVRYFFRREIEQDPELFHGLAFAQLERIGHSLDGGLSSLADALAAQGERIESLLDDLRAHVLDIRLELARQSQHLQDLGLAILQALKVHQLDARVLRPNDSLSLQSPTELSQVRELVGRYRALSQEQRRELPALLNAVGKLEVISGDFAGAREDFRELATIVADSSAQAEAHHHRFRAAIEQQLWDDALDALKRSMRLDPQQFAPFPLAKFEPERILGAGGFGVAILCRNRHSGSRVVVKALRLDGLERAVADVFREAQLLEELDNPAIIRIRDCDFADAAQTRPFIVMDYFEGPTLADYVRVHGPLLVDDLTDVARQIAEGLDAAHACGILHRDVKPANVLVRGPDAAPAGFARRFAVKLIDFGLALRHSVVRATMASVHGLSLGSFNASVAGTLDYAAPEQMGKLSGVAVGPAADVYGFAKTCCFALFQTVQPLRKHWQTVPDRLADLLEQCLAENPNERPGSFAQVLDRLGSLSQSEDLRAKSRAKSIARSASPESASKAASAERTMHGHVGAVLCLDVSRDGMRVLSGGEDHTMRLWDAASGREIRCLPGHRNVVCSLAFTPDGLRAVSSSTDQTVRIWELDAGVAVRSFDRQTNRSVAISNDGKLALTGSLYDGMVRLWELGTGKELRRLKGHTDWVHCVAFSWDGRRILSGGMDRTVRFWDADTGKQLKCFLLTLGRVTDLAFSPCGEQAVSCSDDRLVRFWDLKAGRELARLTGHTDSVLSVAISPDGRTAASAGQDQTVRLWDLMTSREVMRYEGHRGSVLAVRFMPEGNQIISGGSDGTLRIWNTEA